MEKHFVMRSRFSNGLFYACLAAGLAASYALLLAIGFGHHLRVRAMDNVGRARNRVRSARRRVTQAGASFLELLRSSV